MSSVASFLLEHSEYANVYVHCTVQKVMDKLQHVQNAAARVVTGTQKYERDLS